MEQHPLIQCIYSVQRPPAPGEITIIQLMLGKRTWEQMQSCSGLGLFLVRFGVVCYFLVSILKCSCSCCLLYCLPNRLSPALKVMLCSPILYLYFLVIFDLSLHCFSSVHVKSPFNSFISLAFWAVAMLSFLKHALLLSLAAYSHFIKLTSLITIPFISQHETMVAPAITCVILVYLIILGCISPWVLHEVQ